MDSEIQKRGWAGPDFVPIPFLKGVLDSTRDPPIASIAYRVIRPRVLLKGMQCGEDGAGREGVCRFHEERRLSDRQEGDRRSRLPVHDRLQRVLVVVLSPVQRHGDL